MMLLASLYYNFFNENKPSSLIQEYMPALSNIIGITPAEESVYRLVSNGWYDVPDQELDSFLALFSRQFRTAKDSDVTVARK